MRVLTTRFSYFVSLIETIMSGSSKQMKGLTQFIVDIRNSNDAEEETRRIKIEMNNIQTKFSNSNLNSYQRRNIFASSYISRYLDMMI